MRRDGPDAASSEDRQWYRETFSESVDAAVARSVLSMHEDELKETLRRLPASTDARGVELRHWQTAALSKAILELVAAMCDEVVAAFERAGLDPVRDAVDTTAKLRTKLRLPIPSRVVEVFVRTTPSAAKEAMGREAPKKTAALTWSVLFAQASIDRQGVNRGLLEAGYKAVDGDGQIQIRSANALRAALNGLWDVLPEETRATAHLWSVSVPNVEGAAVLARSA